MINFNMTLNMSGGGSFFGAGNLTGAGLASGGFGSPFGGATQGILPAAFNSGGPSSLEMQLLRLMLARAANGADNIASPPVSPVEMRLRAAQDRIEELSGQLEELRRNIVTGKNSMTTMSERLNELKTRMEQLPSPQPK
jgi:hypothetical protein